MPNLYGKLRKLQPDSVTGKVRYPLGQAYFVPFNLTDCAKLTTENMKLFL